MASGKQEQSETDVCRNEVERRSQGKVNRNRAPNEDGPDRDVFFVPPGRERGLNLHFSRPKLPIKHSNRFALLHLLCCNQSDCPAIVWSVGVPPLFSDKRIEGFRNLISHRPPFTAPCCLLPDHSSVLLPRLLLHVPQFLNS